MLLTKVLVRAINRSDQDLRKERSKCESNFPVDKASCPYDVLWNAFKRIAADASPSEKAALFHDSAVRAYRLAR